MKQLTTILTLFGLTFLGLALTPSAKADEWNEKTIVTFNQPVEIPGRVLPAGTYVFKLLDSQSDRNVVQIFNKDENHVYATILAIPDYRMEPKGKTVITFEERRAGAPEAIRAWFYPGRNYGEEFVYPKLKAVELAKANEQHVLSMPNELAANTQHPAKSASEPQVQALKKAPVTAIEHSGNEVALAQVHPPEQHAASTPSTTLAQNTTPKELPHTASSLPLIGLFGLLSLGSAFAVRFARRHFA
ncbi:MAG: hypothetical protein IANPNBLG_00102 [Bryobacteraceae bacterium]|nr:hypothetical protein [Bryobacteraceae bacterium]